MVSTEDDDQRGGIFCLLQSKQNNGFYDYKQFLWNNLDYIILNL